MWCNCRVLYHGAMGLMRMALKNLEEPDMKSGFTRQVQVSGELQRTLNRTQTHVAD